jgi:hypothetical protein
MNTTILWHGSIPLKFIGQPIVARQEHLGRLTRIVQDRDPIRLPVSMPGDLAKRMPWQRIIGNM